MRKKETSAYQREILSTENVSLKVFTIDFDNMIHTFMIL